MAGCLISDKDNMRKLYAVTKMFVVELPDNMEFNRLEANAASKLLELPILASRVVEIKKQIQIDDLVTWIDVE